MNSEEKIIYRLKELSKKLGKTPTRKEYVSEYGKPSFERFGGYNKVLEKAGLTLNMYVQLTNEEIQEKFKIYIKENGIPKSTEIPKNLPSYDLIKIRFGGYKVFLQSIGYDCLLNYWNREKIIKILQDGIDSGEIKSREDLNKKGYPTMTTIKEILNVSTWKETLTIVDRELVSNYKFHDRYNFTKEELKEIYDNLSKKLGKIERGASEKDIRKELGFNVGVFESAFKKKFIDLKKEWGYVPRNSPTFYTVEELIEVLRVKRKEKGSNLTIREIIVDKDLPNITTIYRVFNTKSLKKIYEKI